MEYNIGDIVQVKVTGIEKYGIFVSVNEDISGLIHISEITDSYVHNIKDYVDINEIIRAKIIGFDEDNSSKLKLSIKDIQYSDRFFLDSPIKETASGFENLGKNLSVWIEEKEKEMNEDDDCCKK